MTNVTVGNMYQHCHLHSLLVTKHLLINLKPFSRSHQSTISSLHTILRLDKNEEQYLTEATVGSATATNYQHCYLHTVRTQLTSSRQNTLKPPNTMAM